MIQHHRQEVIDQMEVSTGPRLGQGFNFPQINDAFVTQHGPFEQAADNEHNAALMEIWVLVITLALSPFQTLTPARRHLQQLLGTPITRW